MVLKSHLEKSTNFKMKRKSSVNRNKVVGTHLTTNEAVDLKWYKGASRYNNGATRFENKYKFRFIISSMKSQYKICQ